MTGCTLKQYNIGMYIIYFVHGTTTDNENDIATGWLPGELSALGIKQSQELERLVADKKFDAVFCSDLQRAVDSAELSFGNKYKIQKDQRLREADYGDWNGQPHDLKNNMAVYINQSFPHGESYADVEKRMRAFLDETKEKYQNKHIAVVAHQGPQLALEVICNNKLWDEAIAGDWRQTGAWQPGWNYTY